MKKKSLVSQKLVRFNVYDFVFYTKANYMSIKIVLIQRLNKKGGL